MINWSRPSHSGPDYHKVVQIIIKRSRPFTTQWADLPRGLNAAEQAEVHEHPGSHQTEEQLPVEVPRRADTRAGTHCSVVPVVPVMR